MYISRQALELEEKVQEYYFSCRVQIILFREICNFQFSYLCFNLRRSIKQSVFKGKRKVKNSVKFQELEPKIGEELCKLLDADNSSQGGRTPRANNRINRRRKPSVQSDPHSTLASGRLNMLEIFIDITRDIQPNRIFINIKLKLM